MSVALVGPHASMPDDVWLSGRVFCVSDLVSCGPAIVARGAHVPFCSRAAQSFALRSRRVLQRPDVPRRAQFPQTSYAHGTSPDALDVPR
eukprot:1094373-Prymnesium_polylepis.1